MFKCTVIIPNVARIKNARFRERNNTEIELSSVDILHLSRWIFFSRFHNTHRRLKLVIIRKRDTFCRIFIESTI